jgi:hypothetical protein
MLSKVTFCYELDFARQWKPVLYYGDIPTGGVASRKERDRVVDVSDLPRGADGEVSLSACTKLYPLQKAQKQASITKKEKRMSRPVQGFLSSTGTFHDSEAEADLDDATYELNISAINAIGSLEADDQPRTTEDVVSMLTGFIYAHEDVIYDVITARRKVRREGEGKKPTEERDAVGGPSTSTAPVDGEGVRIRGDSGVVQPQTAKAKPTPTGTGTTKDEEPVLYNPTIADS